MLIDSFSQGQDQRQWWELLALDPEYAHWSAHVHAREVPRDNNDFDSPESADGFPRDIQFSVNSSSQP